jgi:uncharacterized membrane protein YjfL (UPF0719 family)
MLNKIAVTGEGPTDMGCCRNQQPVCTGDDFEVGAVAHLLFKLVYHHLPEWNADLLDAANPAAHMSFVLGSWLGQQSSARRKIRPSTRVKKGFVEHAQRAEALAQYALSHQHELAAYFHDTDRLERQDLVAAIEEGFRAAEFAERGIALVPKPTSEAWFICATKPHPYQHCGQLEDELSGNDRSPQRAPKTVLGQHLQNPDYTRHDLNELVGLLDVTRIDMPSFNELRTQVTTAITAVCVQ